MAAESTDTYGWDAKHYQRGVVNIEGMYNPVLITAQEVEDGEPDVDLLPSENYKSALLATEVIPRALDPMNLDKMEMYLLATAGISAFTLLGVIGLFI